MAAHQAASGRPPSAAADKVKTDEKSLSPVPRRAAVATARYRDRARPAVEAPWQRAIVLPLDRVIGEEYRVGWAVAAHRALVRLIGYGAPPLVTGAYPPGTARPANRIAVHVLGPETPAAPVRLRDQAGRPRSALLLLVPDGADAGDLDALDRGVAGLSSLRGPGGHTARIDQAAVRELAGGEFWQPPAPGRERVWETSPAAIPDTRGNQGWTFADAVLLSLAFTWKDTWADRLPRTGSRGSRYYQDLADAVRAIGADVIEVQPLRTSEVDRYAHKVNEHAVVRPYRAVLRLTGVAGDRVVQAIGQSRHLGGGLLVPRDVPAAGLRSGSTRRETLMERSGFAAFFAALNGGFGPFRWQERLLDCLLENGRWPERIAAPTGAGKTSAIDIHVFAVALTAGGCGPRLPRRLAMVVDRRVLVDDQYQRARTLAAALADPADDAVAEVSARLAGLRWPAGDAGDQQLGRGRGQSPLVTGRLRGGAVPAWSWRDHPGACAVLCATPDMWGSRLLFGGYGTPALAAPREAGLLAFDSAVVVDEAHLAGQLLVTARQVSRLVTAAQAPVTGVPALQVVEVTATPAPGAAGVSVTVDHDDLAEGPLADRLTRAKPVTLIPVPGWAAPGKPGKTAAAAADAAAAMVAGTAGHDDAARTIGCFVNTVPMAVAVSGMLRARKPDGRALRVVMICGQVRPADLARLEEHYPGILSPKGSPDVDVIVATQSLEVGVDLDLAGIVTELAAGSALAQRAGRANRRGLRPLAPVSVLIPAEPLTDRSRSGPYAGEELTAALQWITRRAGDPAGLAPWALREDPPPTAAPRRMLYQRPELADAWHWARTSDDLAADPELDLWLSESLEQETSIGIIIRDAMPADPAGAVGLVRDLPPAPWEVFPVPYRTAVAVLAELLTAGHDSGQAAGRPGGARRGQRGERRRPAGSGPGQGARRGSHAAGGQGFPRRHPARCPAR